ncbi:putative ganglioside induced differentiation associated protein [Planoprotostelium fungivorum]|uniref:Putative ganglioside induced differentiation associated protein n=1 Tax=Planoprotostelium fungivorum TaxID=1890364 RepID=A0A2P6NAS5_9EUKA|nr:putative ganglioside induced differentiation associated protein [Planoprotostelium fungivorum]
MSSDIDQYASLIRLEEPYDRPTPGSSVERREATRRILSHLLSESGYQQKALNHLICIRSADRPLPDSVLSDIDLINVSEWKGKGDSVDPNTIPCLRALLEETDVDDTEPTASHSPDDDDWTDVISIWRGDISIISTDAIVNAANSELLGCFQPDHVCIDNIIHRSAGPRLRQDCSTIMKLQGHAESSGGAKITRAYNLPSSFVFHTVGPIIERGRKPNEEEKKSLSDCYKSILDVAKRVKNIKSITFCGISTGLYGFPSEEAAPIAIQTVRRWLQENRGQHHIDHIIFDTFLERDEEIYRQVVEGMIGKNLKWVQPPTRTHSQLERAAEWVKGADSILIAAGAGLSASAGLDYTSHELFRELFPAMWERGHRCMYEFIGYTQWEPALQWGYLFSQIHKARFNWPKSSVYQNLLRLTRDKEEKKNGERKRSWVITSNADGMFHQNGFDISSVYTPQGDYSRLQCLKRCREDAVWETEPVMNAALPFIHNETQMITDSSKLPTCPFCGTNQVLMNVRGGNWYIEGHFEEKKRRYERWLRETVRECEEKGETLVIVEIGCGFNTPSVIRWPVQRLVENSRNVRLIRINREHSEVAEELEESGRAMSLPVDANEAIDASGSETKRTLESTETGKQMKRSSSISQKAIKMFQKSRSKTVGCTEVTPVARKMILTVRQLAIEDEFMRHDTTSDEEDSKYIEETTTDFEPAAQLG